MDTLGHCLRELFLNKWRYCFFFFNRWRVPSPNISLKPQIIHPNSYILAHTACVGGHQGRWVHRGPQQRGWAETQDRANSWGRSWGRDTCPRLCPERGAGEEEQPSGGRVPLPLPRGEPGSRRLREQTQTTALGPEASGLAQLCLPQGLLHCFLPGSEVSQSCPTLCNPMDCSLPSSSVHGIFQARILEWVAISFSRGSS